MKKLVRWYRFNLVGAVGMVVQVGTLAGLNSALPGHYLLWSLAALEFTLLHNFVWHLHYTWSERRDDSPIVGRLTRFHL